MAHFAELDRHNQVLRVIVVADKYNQTDGVEDENVGIAYCKRLYGNDTNWKQTTKHTEFRGDFAGIGCSYLADADKFIHPTPFESWVLNDNCHWEPPVKFDSSLGSAMIGGIPFNENLEFIADLGLNRRGFYLWNEAETSWDLLETTPEEASTVKPDGDGE